MKKQLICCLIMTSLAAVPLALSSGCASSEHKETTAMSTEDKEIATRIKSALDADPTVKGIEVKVQSLNGEVELSGFVDSQEAKERAGQIAASTPGVLKVYNNLVLPTGR